MFHTRYSLRTCLYGYLAWFGFPNVLLWTYIYTSGSSDLVLYIWRRTGTATASLEYTLVKQQNIFRKRIAFDPFLIKLIFPSSICWSFIRSYFRSGIRVGSYPCFLRVPFNKGRPYYLDSLQQLWHAGATAYTAASVDVL